MHHYWCSAFLLFLLLLIIIINRRGETHHPGRHIVALLAMMNLGVWLVDTFELQARINILLDTLATWHLWASEVASQLGGGAVLWAGRLGGNSEDHAANLHILQVYTSTTTKPTPRSYEVVESNINIASTHPPPQVPLISGADRLLERLLQKRGGGGCQWTAGGKIVKIGQRNVSNCLYCFFSSMKIRLQPKCSYTLHIIQPKTTRKGK